MKKILKFSVLGIPVIPAAVGGFALLSTMFMWYGSFFDHRVQPLMGFVEAQVTSAALGPWYAIGIALTYIQAIGVAQVLKWRNWPSVLESVKTALIISVLLGASVFAYRTVILPDHSIELFLINASGLITAWTLAAVLISILHPSEKERTVDSSTTVDISE